jgi:hypothetical protein
MRTIINKTFYFNQYKVQKTQRERRVANMKHSKTWPAIEDFTYHIKVLYLT